MASGLQVFDGSGQPVFIPEYVTPRFLGNFNVSAPSTGSLVHAGLSTGRPFAIVIPNQPLAYENLMSSGCEVTFSGNTLFWNAYPASSGVGSVSLTVFYGVE